MRQKIFLLVIIIISYSYTQAQTTTPTGNLLTDRSKHQSELLADGRVMIFGGTNYNFSSNVTYKSSEIYNPQTNTWSAGSDMVNARLDFESIVLNDGNILAIGGIFQGVPIKNCEKYDISTGVWSESGQMINPRTNHAAVKLLNGMVLTAGNTYNNDQTAEIFNPATNSWSLTAPMKIVPGRGMTLTLLEDGKVLAIGGETSPRAVQIFDPQSGIWHLLNTQTISERYFHSSVILKDGRVLIMGSGSSTKNKTCEIFNPSTLTFAAAGSLNYGRSFDKAILMDDNRVLIFGLGDFTTPGNTKALEIYNPSTNSWSAPVMSSLGGDMYSINKLNNGKILIAGGLASTGNGSIRGGFVVSSSLLGSCLATNLQLSKENIEACYGKTITVILISSEVGKTYSLYNGENKISGDGPGGTSLAFSIPYVYLSAGKNLIKVVGEKQGCYSEQVAPPVLVNVPLGNNEIVQLNYADTLICLGSSIDLKTNSSKTILWSDSSIVNTLKVTQSGGYFAQTVDGQGCLSLPSKTTFVNFLPSASSLDAGPNSSICKLAAPLKLTGTPTGGSWTGTGIYNKLFFNPDGLSAGKYTLTYNYCGSKDSLNVQVIETTEVPDFSLSFSKDSICPKGLVTISIMNAKNNAGYALYKASTLLKSFSGAGPTYQYTEYTDGDTVRFTVKSNINATCPGKDLIKSKVLKVMPLGDYKVTAKLVKDTICTKESPIAYILKPQMGFKYYAYYSEGSRLSDIVPCTTNQDTLFIKTYPPTSMDYRWHYFKVVNAIGCETTLSSQALVRFVDVVSDFSMSDVAEVTGGTVLTTNLSKKADSYSWTYPANIQILKDSNNVISFTSAEQGIFNVSLSVTSRYSCSRTVTKPITFFKPYTAKANLGLCAANTIHGGDGSALYPSKTMTSHIDSKGNAYVSSYTFSELLYAGTYMNVSKINPDGSLAWTIFQNSSSMGGHPQRYSAYCNAITTDSSGNVYITGSFYSSGMKFNGITVGGGFNPNYTHFYTLKLDVNGKLVWWIASESGGNPHSGTDIVYVDDEHIYISVVGNGVRTIFPNGELKPLTYKGIDLIRINSKGEFIEDLVTSTIYSNNIALHAFHPASSGYYGSYVTYIAPKLKLTGNTLRFMAYFKIGFAINGLKVPKDGLYTYSVNLQTGLFTGLKEIRNANITTSSEISFKEKDKPDIDYFIFNNSLCKYDTSGTQLWKYKFPGNVYLNNAVTLDKGDVLVQGSYNDYILFNDSIHPIIGIKSGRKEDVFIAKFNSDGVLLGIDDLGSLSTDYQTVLLKNKENEVISVGTTGDDLYHNGNLILAAKSAGYYLRGKVDQNCSEPSRVVISYPQNNSIVCDRPVLIKWYTFGADSVSLYYRLQNSLQWNIIQKRMPAT